MEKNLFLKNVFIHKTESICSKQKLTRPCKSTILQLKKNYYLTCPGTERWRPAQSNKGSMAELEKKPFSLAKTVLPKLSFSGFWQAASFLMYSCIRPRSQSASLPSRRRQTAMGNEAITNSQSISLKNTLTSPQLGCVNWCNYFAGPFGSCCQSTCIGKSQPPMHRCMLQCGHGRHARGSPRPQVWSKQTHWKLPNRPSV